MAVTSAKAAQGYGLATWVGQITGSDDCETGVSESLDLSAVVGDIEAVVITMKNVTDFEFRVDATASDYAAGTLVFHVVVPSTAAEAADTTDVSTCIADIVVVHGGMGPAA